MQLMYKVVEKNLHNLRILNDRRNQITSQYDWQNSINSVQILHKVLEWVPLKDVGEIPKRMVEVGDKSQVI